MGFESPEKLLLVVLVAALLLAPSRLPEVGRALGQGIREFKAGVADTEREPPPGADDG
jgi:TatA/E family protein of Tat protein translocase